MAEILNFQGSTHRIGVGSLSELYTEHGLRYSWDLMTVEFAIENESKHYVLSEYGRVNFDELGHTIWQTDNEGLDRYVIWAEGKDKISEDIEQTLLLR